VVRAVAAAGAPPSVLIGVRSALERGRGRPSVPVGSALLGTILAVTALSATTVFGASLTWLVHTPALYGVPYDVNFANEGAGSGAVLTGALLHSLQRDPAIDRVTVATEVEINVNGQHVRTVAVTAKRGPALISVVDGRLPRAALARYTTKYGEDVAGQASPIELINFGESVNFPLLFGVALSLFGAATLVHLLLVSVSRRRAEAGLLKVLGFVRRQVAAVVTWQATAVVLVGRVMGVPLGIAAGKVAWRLFASNVGVVPVEVVQALPLILLAAAALAATNLLAVLPALRAARSRPADLLRAE
jgi:hypothetical protein